MRTRFITSAADLQGFPEPIGPEVAFLGRSNVGKSALLNALAGARLARISRTPGRTRLINFFEVEGRSGRLMLADLPGYGFARVPREMQAEWQPLIEGYLQKRENLRLALLLIDVRRGVQEDDAELVAWLDEQLEGRATIQIVVTKVDKVGKAKLKPALQKVAADLDLPIERVHGTSSTERKGLEGLWDALEATLFSGGIRIG